MIIFDILIVFLASAAGSVCGILALFHFRKKTMVK